MLTTTIIRPDGVTEHEGLELGGIDIEHLDDDTCLVWIDSTGPDDGDIGFEHRSGLVHKAVRQADLQTWLDLCQTGPHAALPVDGHQAVETDAHRAEEPARLAADPGPAQDASPVGQQGGSDGLAPAGLEGCTVDLNRDRLAPFDGRAGPNRFNPHNNDSLC